MKKSLFSLVFIAFSIAGLSQTILTTNYESYLPEVRAMNKGLANFPPLDLSTTESLSKMRSMPASPSKLTLTPENKIISLSSGMMRLRIFRPAVVKAIVIDIHGGGWCIGKPEDDDKSNDEMATKCQVAIVSIDYKLAPENPIPSQINDCSEAIKWVLENAKKEFGIEKIILQGNSAGAHLAVSSALKLRETSQLDSRILGLNLIYGVYDLSKTPSLRQVTDNTLILTKNNITQFWKNSVDRLNQNELQSPTLSPLYADLKGLPPAFFTVGTADALIDDTNFMAARWQTAGNKTMLAIYPECTHLFNNFPTKIAALAQENMNNWIIELIK